MRLRPQLFSTLAALTLIAAIFTLSSCDTSEATPTRTPEAWSATAEPSSSPAVRLPWPDGQPVEQSEWVKERVAAVKAIYGFTVAGEEWLDGYDMRQMIGQPAWFGSRGYFSWAGAGEAKPRSVLHEFGHSYWGAFSIEGQPELSWQSNNGNVSPALLAYQSDLAAFMAQPPDRFEPLRDRFRNLPNLNNGQYPDLHHFGEADMLYMTGGNLDLVPPILRKYFSGYILNSGVGASGGRQLSDWSEAIAWFSALEGYERHVAGELFGIQHFPLGAYSGLPASSVSGLDANIRTVYEHEERQKLDDFEAQFAEMIDREFALEDAVGTDRGFDFWRGYLSDKLSLHLRYRDVLVGIGTDRSNQLADALDYYASIAGASESEQVESFKRNSEQPLVSELAVLLKPRAIVELFSDTDASDGVLSALGGRADRLSALVLASDRVAISANTDPAQGAAEFESFISSLPESQLRSDIYLLLDLLRSSREGLLSDVLPAMSDAGILLLLRVAPGAARAQEIGPERLLLAVGITADATLEEIASGAKSLADSSSGNFAIDAQYDEAVFTHLDRFVDVDPAGVVRAIDESGMRLVPWISRESDGAIRAMAGATQDAVDLLLGLEGSRETPERIIHLLTREDAALAATLATLASEETDDGLPGKVIRTFAYDAYWSERSSGPNVGPEVVAEFFFELSERLGIDETVELLSLAVNGLQVDATAGDVETGGSDELRRTLEGAAEEGRAIERERIGRLLSLVNWPK